MLNPKFGIAIFTDGSCLHTDRSGGWAWVAIDAIDGEAHDSGSEPDTTISRMELTAAYKALTQVYDICGPAEILVYSDSEYVVLGSKDRTRKRAKNLDLWLLLDAAQRLHKLVEWHHVRGHAEHHYNHLADRLAGEARKEGNDRSDNRSRI